MSSSDHDAGAAPSADLSAVILSAKLGRTRKDAQEDTCAVFAAALHDELKERGIYSRIFTAAPSTRSGIVWYHAVVKVGSVYYDSMGEFTEAVYRTRARIHPRVSLDIGFKPDRRAFCYEEEFDEMHLFYRKVLSKAMNALQFGIQHQLPSATVQDEPAEPEATGPRP
jgi:hypothetical protein